ncbi:MAG TPA: glycine cleavage T C-terminal barrel domain-containing protein [Pyrinomonadaceae bacterium]|jgi:folate-binding protein YgfZ|nr:glycine cleavage T C-terminal barrel domain-containing protein [Pyrinomonadaceae bacterium]
MSEAASTSWSKDYAAVREGGAGLIDLSSRGRILVNGSDAAMFLNGLVTNDVKNLAVNSWIPAAFATVQGRLLAAVRIIHHEDGFLIDTEDTTHERVFRLLERFTLAGDFQVTDVTSETASISLQGRDAARIMRETFGREAADDLERGNVHRTKQGLDVFPATHTAEEGFDIVMPVADRDAWGEEFQLMGAVVVDQTTQEILRIEAGEPRYGIDMDDNTVVTETNLDDAVSFTKGCYTGQEIIIRIKHRGHVAKKLTGLLFPGEPFELNELTIYSEDEREAGRVTSWTKSPQLGFTVALAYVKFEYLRMFTHIQLEAGGRIRKGCVCKELPFVRGSWYDGIPSAPLRTKRAD